EAADEWVFQRARIELVAFDRAGAPFHKPLAPVEVAEEAFAVRVAGGGGARRVRGRGRRPAAGCRERCRQHEAGTRRRHVADRLRDVPVTLTAGHGEGSLRECLHDVTEGGGRRRELLDRPPGRAGPRPATDLAADPDEPALVDRPPGRDDVRRSGLELRDPSVPGHRLPFAIFTASGRPRSRHIAAIPIAGPTASIQNARRQAEPPPGSRAPTTRTGPAVSRNPDAS